MSRLQKNILNKLASLGAVFFITGLLFSAPANAQDCGLPPQEAPDLPDGDAIDRDELVAAIAAVKQYSADVNAYLDCMDARQKLLFVYLTEAQRDRWITGIEDVIADLSAIEIGMNDQITKFNARAKLKDSE